MFRIFKKSKKSKARVGIIKTAHGIIKTPFFMPDATRGFVKMIDNHESKKFGIQSVVINTLHLYLQPGVKVIKKFKGAHNFMNWQKSLLSDSGGFQIFSLIHKSGKMGSINDDGAIFKSPIDGAQHKLTPEKSIQIQFDLGVDMIVALDDCPPNEFERASIEKSVKRTIEWAKRCREEYDKQVKKRKIASQNFLPLLFGVIHGGAELDLRKKCAVELIKLNFDGYCFGARPVDKQGNFLDKALQCTADLIPEDKLRFALGVGRPEDIFRCVKYGWDMFDCVIPTREARHGRLYKFFPDYGRICSVKYIPLAQKSRMVNRKSKIKNSNFKIESNFKPQTSKFYDILNINNSKFRADTNSIDRNCDCELCQDYSAGYMHHLFKIKEPLGARLATIHNLKFYLKLMEIIRKEIKRGEI
ncbi:tRNA guanosine(34) transglycosylase Tgt [Candidatus Kuenenbacteria bacterium CG11_big_fil_rev_8_21_14_0_20_37_9]|uniref:tRNA guanosine(34) transglycosylase Tgt n=1 Tax=Candidatus Kuenenbacteria bacterium CG08_land_8_20_14_0_20_37_23 TaxID=1974617 RepID=A0A2M6XRX7_9BACT|nr:MAG: tRNA guanosine(34) transglycosylase Tgt [Candidatus Kuenenbacteria bacterium CG11_big_fil_rev_8_21_14_0_20_37_9]PIU10380.1 MAG: tRNA guanosine(34) transglycosylase Tgt [Candidatus Kuenenbacteria bacterium CG08_land_8_20_14_0_20_37_23]